jgi:hypothetical protein
MIVELCGEFCDNKLVAKNWTSTGQTMANRHITIGILGFVFGKNNGIQQTLG